MDFERADLNEDDEWFEVHWPVYEREMSGHALASFPTFQWKGFRSWLKTCNVGRAQELYQTFEKMAAKHRQNDTADY